MTAEDLSGLYLLGTRVKRVRELRGLSQDELASQSGVSQASISLVEKNKRLPSVENLAKLALTLKVPTDFLIGMPGSGAEGGAPEDVNAFFRHAGEISTEDKRLALDIIDAIKKRRKKA